MRIHKACTHRGKKMTNCTAAKEPVAVGETVTTLRLKLRRKSELTLRLTSRLASNLTN